MCVLLLLCYSGVRVLLLDDKIEEALQQPIKQNYVWLVQYMSPTSVLLLHSCYVAESTLSHFKSSCFWKGKWKILNKAFVVIYTVSTQSIQGWWVPSTMGLFCLGSIQGQDKANGGMGHEAPPPPPNGIQCYFCLKSSIAFQWLPLHTYHSTWIRKINRKLYNINLIVFRE